MFRKKIPLRRLIRKSGDENILDKLKRFIDENEPLISLAVFAAWNDWDLDDELEMALNILFFGGGADSGSAKRADDIAERISVSIGERLAEAFNDEDIQRAYENAADYAADYVRETTANIQNVPNVSPSVPNVSPSVFDYKAQYAAWCERHCGDLIVEITDGQRNAVREVINQAMQEGRGYLETARDIKRYVGLTERQQAANARYRDRIFSKAVRDIPPDNQRARQRAWERASRAADRYAERQRNYRAKMIARTEIAKAQTAAMIEYVKWAQGLRLLGDVHGEWITSGRDNVCRICSGLNHMEVDLFGGNLPPIHPNCACAVKIVDGGFDFDKKDVDNSGGSGIIEVDRESGISGKVRTAGYDNTVDLDYINSDEFKAKFKKLPYNDDTNRELLKAAKAMLTHRNKTDKEDIYLIDSVSGKTVGSQVSSISDLGVSYNKSMNNAIANAKPYTLVSIHNHPTNNPPTGSDFVSMGAGRYKSGVVVCHNGEVYWYKAGSVPFMPTTFGNKVEELIRTGLKEKAAIIQTLNDFSKSYGIEWREIK